jgi:hypothetical protein
MIHLAWVRAEFLLPLGEGQDEGQTRRPLATDEIVR